MALGQEPSGVGEGHQEEAVGEGHSEGPSLTSNFLMFSGGQGLWEAANHPGSCGSTFLSSRQLKIPAFPYFWPHPSLSSHLIKIKVLPFCPHPHPLMFPWGRWTRDGGRLSGLG